MDTVIQCIDGAKPSTFSSDLGDLFRQSRAKITSNDVKVTTNGDSAEASFSLTIAINTTDSEADNPNSKSTIDTIPLKRADGKWRIMPGNASAIKLAVGDSISLYSTLLAYPTFAAQSEFGKNIRPTIERSIAADCLTRAKQVGLAIIMFAQDHDEKFPPKATAYQESIKPYVKKDDGFLGYRLSDLTCPKDQPGTVSFVFNKNLQGVSLDKIEVPSKTIMLYEGADEHLDPRHYGHAVVAFADGSCRLISSEQAGSLQWKP